MVNKDQSTKKLLIISCSQRKKNLPGKIRAWDLYDGVVFRMLKKIEREVGLPGHLDILILSAKYGFIRPSERIRYYDQRLKKADITLKRDDLLTGLRKISKTNYSNVLVCLGKDYLECIRGFNKCFPNQPKVHYVSGGIGSKMARVKGWVMRLKCGL
jgi:hypothetical protein